MSNTKNKKRQTPIAGKPIQLKPFVSSGAVVFRPDASDYDIVPLSLFALNGGGAVLRIGPNVFWFNADGSYDGTEASVAASFVADADRARRLSEDLEQSAKNIGQAPAEAYFAPDTQGHVAETAIWPPKARGAN